MPERPLTDEERDKIKAEADEIRARISKDTSLAAINERKAKADAKKAEADAIRASVSLDIERLMLEEHQIQRDQILRQEELNLASNVHHRLYEFNEEVNHKSVSQCMSTLSYWSRTKPKADIEIRFTSPGGDMTAGFVLYDYIQELKRNEHEVTTSTLGMAASMASALLQAGSTRVMGREAWLLIHEGSFGVGGSAGEIEDAVEWYKRLRDRMVDVYLDGMARNKAAKPMNKRQFKEKWSRREWFLDSNEALALGLVDIVR